MNKERRAAENEQFTKVLMVAEKPSVAKMIAEHLSGGRFRTRRGQSRANQIFEFIKWLEPAKVSTKFIRLICKNAAKIWIFNIHFS